MHVEPTPAPAPSPSGQARAPFRWDVPPRFNFGVDVVDRHARDEAGEALVWEGPDGRVEAYTYADMARLTARFGNALRAAGVGRGDRVLVMLPRIPQWPIAMVGALKVGAVPIPCIEMLTAKDVAYRVIDSGATAIVCRAAEAGKFRGLDSLRARVAVGEGAGPGWTAWDAAMTAGSDILEPADTAAEDPAVLYYTSGSTGLPKGVLHAARALFAWRTSAEHWLDLHPGDRIWCTADTGWSKAGTSILFGPWSRGACAFLHDGPFDPGRRLDLLARHRITVYCAPATELARVAAVQEAEPRDLSALRRTVSAGEAMNPAVLDRWERTTGLRVAEAYGQTETLMTVLNRPGDPVKPGSMGTPSPGSDVDVVDESGRPCPDGIEGDLAVRTPNPQLMLGYWRDPERTAACYRDGPDSARWFITGDRGWRDGDGYLWYAGRTDDVIGSAGYRIGPLEVENALLEHPAVLECAVVGAPDEERGEIVKAFVVLREAWEGTPALIAALQAHAKAATAPYKYPRAVEFVDALPRTPTGKLRRRTLKELELERAHVWSAGPAAPAVQQTPVAAVEIGIQ